MDFVIERSDDPTVLVIKGVLNVDIAFEIKKAMLEALGNGIVVLDMSEVKEIDISCLQLFCSAHRSASAAGKKISVSGCSGPIRRKAAEAGLLPNACKEKLAGDCLWGTVGGCGEIPG